MNQYQNTTKFEVFILKFAKKKQKKRLKNAFCQQTVGETNYRLIITVINITLLEFKVDHGHTGVQCEAS